MHISNQLMINKNPMLKRYLRENSYYYKYLNRDNHSIKNLYNEMQKKYKLTLPDRLDKVKENLDMITSFMDIMK